MGLNVFFFFFSFFQTYAYHDEHSAPFSWRTRSQQDLAFESGRPPSVTSGELEEAGMETVAASPSRILARCVETVKLCTR